MRKETSGVNGVRHLMAARLIRLPVHETRKLGAIQFHPRVAARERADSVIENRRCRERIVKRNLVAALEEDLGERGYRQERRRLKTRAHFVRRHDYLPRDVKAVRTMAGDRAPVDNRRRVGIAGGVPLNRTASRHRPEELAAHQRQALEQARDLGVSAEEERDVGERAYGEQRNLARMRPNRAAQKLYRHPRFKRITVRPFTQRVGLLIDREIAALDAAPGVSIVSGGIFADIAEGFRAVIISMAVGVVLVYLVMVASLGSLRNPLVIVTSLPLALIGVLVALAVTGHSLGIAAMMGILLLIGIVVTNAIVLITFVEQLRRRGLSVYDALVTGGRVRLRPILMTALTTSFALVPLAATAQEGGIVSAELATVVIGGLASSTLLTLFAVPIVYTLFHDTIPGLFRRDRILEED